MRYEFYSKNHVHRLLQVYYFFIHLKADEMGKPKKISPLKKVVDERFSIHRKRGGGLVRMEAWENENGKIEKYGMSYINFSLPSDENGRVIGYDNAHDFHHRHYKGDIYPVNDFVSYEDLVNRFSQELMEFVK